MNTPKKSVYRATSIVAVFAVVVTLGALAKSQYVQSDGMFRDSSIEAMLPAQTVDELTSARPLHTKREYVPEGSMAYTVNGEQPAVIFTNLGVRCKASEQICGSSSGPKSDPNPQRVAGAFGFEVVGGRLVSYSSGDVRKHPDAYRADVMEVAQQQIAYWRNAERVAGAKDSL
ncbi:hypothetical protein D769_00025 [Cupriavidus sp. HMR-1]|uniref:hypothetical protein n=1 Tax=Cupriavidus sp. HMR-1 TaxID=1249621 RepID=UPI0002A3E003|nr:hypothetical protein [Cupriavidus sp. HMR-1]ELA01468.1 hypothetical protein D769_00025 [Cupriavidus sp. HMR-1]